MYSLLIVDDEIDVVESLYSVFKMVEHIDLDVHTAYSGYEAIEVLNSTRVDVVLTDICMPGMTGLQLIEKIRSNWPECRVVFLTGYEEFDYIYAASRYDGVNYLLKNEGFDEIVGAVEKAIQQIENSLKESEIINKANEHIQTIKPFMQREYVQNIISGWETTVKEREKQFYELSMPLHYDEPIILLLGKIMDTQSWVSPISRSRLLFSIEEIANKKFSPVLNTFFMECERSIVLWIVQPKDFKKNNPQNEEFSSVNIFSFINGSAAAIQTACKDILNVSMSLIMDNEKSSWEGISDRYEALKMLLNSKVGSGEDLIFVNRKRDEGRKPINQPFPFKKVKHLEIYLESGQENKFLKTLSDVLGNLEKVSNENYNPDFEVLYSISLMFLSYINRYGLTEKLAFKINLNKLIHVDAHGTRYQAFEYFRKLGSIIFEIKEMDRSDSRSVINQVMMYINENLDEDLSLVHLAEKVYYNPSYLSRLFKEITGKNLLTYINEARIAKAKELLANSDLKIYKIASAVGFESASYFTQFFRKTVKTSPQEYRKLHINM